MPKQKKEENKRWRYFKNSILYQANDIL